MCAIRSAAKIIQMRRDIDYNPHKYLILVVMCRLLPPNHLIPTVKLHLFSSPTGMLCVCIHWVMQSTKQHLFLIHAGCVYTICVLSFLFFSLMDPFLCNNIFHLLWN